MTTPSRPRHPTEEDRLEAVYRIELAGTLDRHALEALQLEIRRLAKLHGVEVKQLEVKRKAKSSSRKLP